jgi:phage terminase large subunit-like protein
MPPVDEPRALQLLSELPSLLDVERELYTRDLYEFAKGAWHVLEPGRKFKDNWHIRVVCRYLQLVSEGQIHRLLINIPPRHMKSLLVSVIWPVWDWIRTPTRQFLTASYVQKLSTRDALKSRQLIQSPWFQARFGHIFQLGKDQNEKQRYQNDKRGHRIAISVSGGVGEGGDILIADDPQNTDEMQSDAYVEATTDWWNGTFNQRLNDQNDGAIVLTMQRLSERDLCEEALKEGGWVHLMFPAEFEQARRCVTPWGIEDPRTAEGELLWPDRVGPEALAKMKFRLGSYGTAGQLQQRPAPKGGGIIKREGYRFIKRSMLPPFFAYAIYWDTAATEDEQNDPTGATVWGLSNTPGRAGLFKLGQLEEWLDTPALEKRIPEFVKAWPTECGFKPGAQIHGVVNYIEAAGPTGLALFQLLKKKHPTLLWRASQPKELGGGKNDRAHLAAIHIENGLVWLIEDDPTNEGFLSKSDAFPKCKPRDVVDSAIGAILECTKTYTFEAAGWSYEGGKGGATAGLPDDDEDDF